MNDTILAALELGLDSHEAELNTFDNSYRHHFPDKRKALVLEGDQIRAAIELVKSMTPDRSAELPELLKSCPFCGGDPVEDGKSDDVRIRCETCGVQGNSFGFDGDNEDDIDLATKLAHDAWNSRALGMQCSGPAVAWQARFRATSGPWTPWQAPMGMAATESIIRDWVAVSKKNWHSHEVRALAVLRPSADQTDYGMGIDATAEREAIEELAPSPETARTTDEAALALAVRFHEAYERLAPSFGYETRTGTRQFDSTTTNGRLMLAVCAELGAPRTMAAQPAVGEAERITRSVISQLFVNGLPKREIGEAQVVDALNAALAASPPPPDAQDAARLTPDAQAVIDAACTWKDGADHAARREGLARLDRAVHWYLERKS